MKNDICCIKPLLLLAAFIFATPVVRTEANTNLFPSIYDFRNPGSDRFIVDFEDVRDGHPFKGLHVNTSSDKAHQGIHIYFHNEDYASTDISNFSAYPPIYALADMEITSVDFSYVSSKNQFRHIKVTGTMATSGNSSQCYSEREMNSYLVTAGYSIEPFVVQADETLYHPYVTVSVGDIVRKGDIIAYMYLPPNTPSSHIHFNLNVYRPGQNSGAVRAPPDVWNSAVVTAFYGKCQNYSGGDWQWKSYGDCIAVDIAANESLYNEGVSDCTPNRAVRNAAPLINSPVILQNGCAITTTTTTTTTSPLTTTAATTTEPLSTTTPTTMTAFTSTTTIAISSTTAAPLTTSPDSLGFETTPPDSSSGSGVGINTLIVPYFLVVVLVALLL